MATQPETSALDRILGPLAECFTPEVAKQIADLRAPESVQAHIEDLATKCTEGKLSDEERAEYETLVSAGTFIATLQSKARTLLQNNTSL